VLRLHARHLRHDPNGVGLLEDVHGRYPGRTSTVAVLPVKVAEHVTDETADPALERVPDQRRLSRVASRDVHMSELLRKVVLGLLPPRRRATGVPRHRADGLPRWHAGLPRLPGGLSGWRGYLSRSPPRGSSWSNFPCGWPWPSGSEDSQPAARPARPATASSCRVSPATSCPSLPGTAPRSRR